MFTSRRVLTGLLVVIMALILPGGAAHATSPPTDWGDGSLRFVENVGQFHPDVRFQVQGAGAAIWLTDDALWLTLVEQPAKGASPSLPRRAVHLRLSFPNANPHPRLEPFQPQETTLNYYRGNDPARWHTRVPVWGGVRYVNLYPGVNLEITGRNGRWAWRLVAQPAARNLGDIRLRVEGADAVAVEDNLLRLKTALGEMALPLPATVERLPTLAAPGVSRLAAETFEVSHPFAPADSVPVAPRSQNGISALVVSTYLGGSGYDAIESIATDGSGAVYVTGATFSPNFPTEGPGATSSLQGNCDLFIVKLDKPALLFGPVYATYLGGSYTDAAWEDFFTDWGLDIAVENGAAYVAGSTWANDFPTTPGAFDTTFNGPATNPDWSPPRPGSDAIIVKLDADGNLAYATYLGGSGYDVPGDGRGGGNDEARGIAVKGGIIYVTGSTLSADFPTTPGAYKRTYANIDIGLNDDVFVAKLNPAGNGSADLLYATFLGGGDHETGNDIAVDDAGMVYVTGYARGYSSQRNADFPTTPGAFDTELRSSKEDAFFFKLNPAGNGSADLLYSTLLGMDDGMDYGNAIAVDAAGDVYLVGNTDSADFPTTPGAFDTTCGSDGTCNFVPFWGAADDIFVAKLNPGGNGKADLLYSTFLGGGHFDGFVGDWADITLDDDNDVYVTGHTWSDDFPLTPDAYDDVPSHAKAFVARLRLQGNGQDDLLYSTFLGGSGFNRGLGIALESKGVVWVAGRTDSSDFPITTDAFDKYHNGDNDGFVTKLLVPPPAPDLSPSTKQVSPQTARVGDVVTFTVRLVNAGNLTTTVSLTDTLPSALVLQGNPLASAGQPAVNGQIITWQGTMTPSARVAITYTTRISAGGTFGSGSLGTGSLAPPLVNHAEINDGVGNVYLRYAYINGYRTFLPVILKR